MENLCFYEKSGGWILNISGRAGILFLILSKPGRWGHLLKYVMSLVSFSSVYDLAGLLNTITDIVPGDEIRALLPSLRRKCDTRYLEGQILEGHPRRHRSNRWGIRQDGRRFYQAIQIFEGRTRGMAVWAPRAFLFRYTGAIFYYTGRYLGYRKYYCSFEFESQSGIPLKLEGYFISP